MTPHHPTRRTVLKTGLGAAAFATTASILTPLKTFAARAIFWATVSGDPTKSAPSGPACCSN